MTLRLLLIVLALAAIWWWRRSRRRAQAPLAHARPSSAPQPMVACRRCGTHVPRQDSVPGREGLYCSPRHRTESEGA